MPATPAQQFWLMTGEVPTGPFTVEQIHTELASGRATWQTPACAVGGHEWRPLVQTPGVGPTPVSPLAPPASPASSSPPAEPAVPVPSVTVGAAPVKSTAPDRTAERAGVLIGIGLLFGAIALIGGLVYLGYEWLRPYTPLEVCRKFDEAKTAAEAKKYTTPRMHKLVDELFKDQTPDDPNTAFEFTRESDGPDPGVKLVGFRGSMWVPEAGKRLQMEGHFRMVRTGGWKADDMVFTGAEGVAVDAPVSLVDEFHRGTFRTSNPTPAPKVGGATKTPLTQPPVPRTGIAGVFDRVLNNYGWAGVVAVLAVIAAAVGVWEWIKKKSA